MDEVMDCNWIGGLIILNPIFDKFELSSQLMITNDGKYDGTDILFAKSGDRFYAPIIEENNEFYTEEEYYSSSVEI